LENSSSPPKKKTQKRQKENVHMLIFQAIGFFFAPTKLVTAHLEIGWVSIDFMVAPYNTLLGILAM